MAGVAGWSGGPRGGGGVAGGAPRSGGSPSARLRWPGLPTSPRPSLRAAAFAAKTIDIEEAGLPENF